MSTLRDIRRDFIELWGSLAPLWGVPPTTGRVLGYLLSRADGATAEEIMADVGLSRGAVSMAAKELRDWGLASERRAEGSRQTVYRAETDLERVIKNVVLVRKRREWDPILTHVRAWLPQLKDERSDDAKALRERLRQIEGVVAMADSFARSFVEGGLVQKLGLKAFVAASGRAARKRS